MKWICGCHCWPVSYKHLGRAFRSNVKKEVAMCLWNISGEYVLWICEVEEIIVEVNKQDNLHSKLL